MNMQQNYRFAEYEVAISMRYLFVHNFRPLAAGCRQSKQTHSSPTFQTLIVFQTLLVNKSKNYVLVCFYNHCVYKPRQS